MCGTGIVIVAAAAVVGRLGAQDQKSSPYPSGLLVPSGAVVLHDDTPANTALPANFPDKFAWKLFLEVNRKCRTRVRSAAKPGNPMSNDALWETWADDPLTFPAHPDPANPPQWPAAGQAPKRAKTLAPPLRRRAELLGQEDSRVRRGSSDRSGIHRQAHPRRLLGPRRQGRRRGSPPEQGDFRLHRQQWSVVSAKASRRSSTRPPRPRGTTSNSPPRRRQFPRASIEVKANWIVIDEKDKSRFHWNYNEAGQLLGLVAIHIISKDLPNWFWCTFEHVDNPGRGDFIGIHDSFGADPRHTPSNTDKAGQTYPAERMKDVLLKLFEEIGISRRVGRRVQELPTERFAGRLHRWRRAVPCCWATR